MRGAGGSVVVLDGADRLGVADRGVGPGGVAQVHAEGLGRLLGGVAVDEIPMFFVVVPAAKVTVPVLAT